jgi:spore germination protein GerM
MRALAGTALCCVALVGCGVRPQSSAERIAADDIPFELGGTTPSETADVGIDSTTRSVVYLVADESLREVIRAEGAVDAASAMSLLEQGPSDEEAQRGLRTAVVPDLAVVTGVDGDVATVDLSAEFSSLAPLEQRLALAQITYTLTQLTGIGAVKFLVAGEDVSVPTADGLPVARPVTRSDYGALMLRAP